jgi:receptor expression-enhancing protein 1/2/3/4
MIGNYLSTLLVCVFAYLYPLFLCFKVKDFSFSFLSLFVFRKFFPSFPARGKRQGARDADFFFFFSNKQALEMHKKSPEKLRGWCIYWLVLATFTVFERITDAFLFFLPLYHEAKVAFVVYLWHPKSQGALYIYDKFVAPTLSKHEGLIDRKIEETQAKVGDVFFTYSKMAYAYVQKMTLQLLQSLPTAQAAMQAQQQQAGAGGANASEPVNPIKKEPVATEAK